DESITMTRSGVRLCIRMPADNASQYSAALYVGMISATRSRAAAEFRLSCTNTPSPVCLAFHPLAGPDETRIVHVPARAQFASESVAGAALSRLHSSDAVDREVDPHR